MGEVVARLSVLDLSNQNNRRDLDTATYLYIDKQMQDHGLFQAICRVNRLDGDDKEYGYVIDYKDLFKSLEGAVKDYTSRAFDAYDKEEYRKKFSDGRIKKKIHRPGRLSMFLNDPSESAESHLIEDAIAGRFRVLERKEYGGTLLQLIFKDII